MSRDSFAREIIFNYNRIGAPLLVATKKPHRSEAMKESYLPGKKWFKGKFWAEASGTAGVEYAVLVAVTVSLLLTGMYFYSNMIEVLYTDLAGKLFK